MTAKIINKTEIFNEMPKILLILVILFIHYAYPWLQTKNQEDSLRINLM